MSLQEIARRRAANPGAFETKRLSPEQITPALTTQQNNLRISAILGHPRSKEQPALVQVLIEQGFAESLCMAVLNAADAPGVQGPAGYPFAANAEQTAQQVLESFRLAKG